MKRVVITGLGGVMPIGEGRQDIWDSVKRGVCGIDNITRFDAAEYTCRIAAEVKNFNPEKYIDKKEARRMDLFAQYAIASAKMAIQDSGYAVTPENAWRTGVILGVGVGGIGVMEEQCKALLEKGPGRVSPFFIPMMITNIAAGHIAIATGAKGINEVVTTACASGTHAVGDAFRVIQRGDADVIMAGGAESAVTPLSIAGFCSMKALSTRNDDPKSACSPFDMDRDGFIMGEGAAILVLEELEHAKRRGADIICEVVGYGASDDAYHITAPDPGGEGCATAMRFAMKDANVSPKDISYINAHGTSTPYNDRFETSAIKDVMGDYAYKIPVSSTKAMTGHMLGAAGAAEALICALAIKDSYYPPTLNYKTPDPECDLDYIPNIGREGSMEYAMSNSLGFGGHNATIILRTCVQ